MKRIAVLWLIGMICELIMVVFFIFVLLSSCTSAPSNPKVITDRAEFDRYIAAHQCEHRYIGWKCMNPTPSTWIEVSE